MRVARIGEWIKAHKAVVLAVAAGFLALRCVFALDVTNFGVVTRFGRIAQVHSEPGMHFKWPHEQVTLVDKRLHQTRPPASEYLTTDKKNIVVETLAMWQVTDPRKFLESLGQTATADVRLASALVSETGAVLGNFASGALLAPVPGTSQYQKIIDGIRAGLMQIDKYGIGVLDVRILDISLPAQNKESVFERMKAERGRIAKALRTAGELEAKKIIAAADREKIHIEMEAYAKARLIKAQGDAQASRIYAGAFGQNPGLYKFTRTLQAYEKVLDENTTVFLPADAEALGLLGARRGDGKRK
ncbi:MAG: protease modulator HflC [Betaproteobacteria bacterium]|nr:protease modulator HflC [Betaproteobacteria bacterium]